jgi:putative membrane protein
MFLDFALASLHHVLLVLLVAILAIEFALLRPGLGETEMRRLSGVDLWYGIVAGILLGVGLARVWFGLKGPDYYLHNPLFWTKLGLFIVIALLSIPPTIRFIGWSRQLKADAGFRPDDAAVKATRAWLFGEAALLLLIPVIAAALARGLLD